MLELLKCRQKAVYFVPRLTDGYIDANIDEMKFGRLCPNVFAMLNTFCRY
jgi:hypothetical protein